MSRMARIGLPLFLVATAVMAVSQAQDSSTRASRVSPTPVAPSAPPRVKVEGATNNPAGGGGSLADRLQGIRRSVTEDYSTENGGTSSRRPRPPQPLSDEQEATPEAQTPAPQESQPAPAATVPVRTARALTPTPPAAPLTGPLTPPKGAASAGALVTTLGPHLRVEAFGPAAMTLNRSSKLVVKALNLENEPAHAVQVQLRLPAWVEVSGGEATRGAARPTDAARGEWVWSIESLAPTAAEELTLSLIPKQTRPFDVQLSWICNPPSQSATIAVQEPKLEMTISGAKDIMFGESKIYTISLTNPGTGDAENVALTLMPLMPSQRPLEAKSIGTIKAGQRKDIDVELTARQAGTLSIKAKAVAEGGIAAEAAEEILVRRAELAVTITGPQLKYAGHPAEYKVRVANTGNAPATGIVASATLPNDVELVSRGEGATAGAAGSVQFLIGQLGPNDSRTFTFECVMRSEGELRVKAVAKDANDLTAEAEAATTIEAVADLKLAINDPPGPIPVGDDLTYEITLVNRGSKAATAIDIAAFFSDGVEPISVQGAQANVATGQVNFTTIERLEAGAERVIKIIARANQPGTHVFRAVVQCDSSETRLSAEDATRFFGEAQAPAARPIEAPGAEEPAATEAAPTEPAQPGRFELNP